MPDPNSDDTIQLRRRNQPGAHVNGNGRAHTNGKTDPDVTMPAKSAADPDMTMPAKSKIDPDITIPAKPKSAPALPPQPTQPAPIPYSGSGPAFMGTLAALIFFTVAGVGGYYTYHALKHLPATSTASTSTTTTTQNQTTPQPPVAPKAAQSLGDPATWILSAEPAQNLTGDGNADIGWWTRTFYLPNQGKVTGYLKGEGITVTRLVALHYEDAKDATTITYQVQGEVPDQLIRVPKATWAPSDPDLKPFASVLVLDRTLPAGQFWNTQKQSVAEAAGTKLDFAWKVQLDKASHAVTADRLPYNDGVFTPQQVAQFASETNNTVEQLRAQVQAINARVAADTQGKLAAIPANPPKPELMSAHWNHGDGSGEPTKSAERMGGATVAGAAGGAAFGAAAGDAGMGAGIGAGVGLLGGFIYDTVSKNNDRHRYEDHARAVNGKRMSAWRAQVKVLDKQRDQIKQDAEAEKQQMIQDLVTRIAAAGGHLDTIPVPSDVSPAAVTQLASAPAPQPAASHATAAPTHPQSPSPALEPAPETAPGTYSDAPSAQPPADQPSGPIK